MQPPPPPSPPPPLQTLQPLLLLPSIDDPASGSSPSSPSPPQPSFHCSHTPVAPAPPPPPISPSPSPAHTNPAATASLLLSSSSRNRLVDPYSSPHRWPVSPTTADSQAAVTSSTTMSDLPLSVSSVSAVQPSHRPLDVGHTSSVDRLLTIQTEGVISKKAETIPGFRPTTSPHKSTPSAQSQSTFGNAQPFAAARNDPILPPSPDSLQTPPSPPQPQLVDPGLQGSRSPPPMPLQRVSELPNRTASSNNSSSSASSPPVSPARSLHFVEGYSLDEMAAKLYPDHRRQSRKSLSSLSIASSSATGQSLNWGVDRSQLQAWAAQNAAALEEVGGSLDDGEGDEDDYEQAAEASGATVTSGIVAFAADAWLEMRVQISDEEIRPAPADICSGSNRSGMMAQQTHSLGNLLARQLSGVTEEDEDYAEKASNRQERYHLGTGKGRPQSVTTQGGSKSRTEPLANDEDDDGGGEDSDLRAVINDLLMAMPGPVRRRTSDAAPGLSRSAPNTYMDVFDEEEYPGSEAVSVEEYRRALEGNLRRAMRPDPPETQFGAPSRGRSPGESVKSTISWSRKMATFAIDNDADGSGSLRRRQKGKAKSLRKETGSDSRRSSVASTETTSSQQNSVFGMIMALFGNTNSGSSAEMKIDRPKTQPNPKASVSSLNSVRSIPHRHSRPSLGSVSSAVPHSTHRRASKRLSTLSSLSNNTIHLSRPGTPNGAPVTARAQHPTVLSIPPTSTFSSPTPLTPNTPSSPFPSAEPDSFFSHTSFKEQREHSRSLDTFTSLSEKVTSTSLASHRTPPIQPMAQQPPPPLFNSILFPGFFGSNTPKLEDLNTMDGGSENEDAPLGESSDEDDETGDDEEQAYSETDGEDCSREDDESYNENDEAITRSEDVESGILHAFHPHAGARTVSYSYDPGDDAESIVSRGRTRRSARHERQRASTGGMRDGPRRARGRPGSAERAYDGLDRMKRLDADSPTLPGTSINSVSSPRAATGGNSNPPPTAGHTTDLARTGTAFGGRGQKGPASPVRSSARPASPSFQSSYVSLPKSPHFGNTSVSPFSPSAAQSIVSKALGGLGIHLNFSNFTTGPTTDGTTRIDQTSSSPSALAEGAGRSSSMTGIATTFTSEFRSDFAALPPSDPSQSRRMMRPASPDSTSSSSSSYSSSSSASDGIVARRRGSRSPQFSFSSGTLRNQDIGTMNTSSASTPWTPTRLGSVGSSASSSSGVGPLVSSVYYKNGLYISVDQPVTNEEEGYTAYRVTVKLLRANVLGFRNRAPRTFVVYKRYREFRAFYLSIFATYRKTVLTWPEFPRKSFFDRFDPSTISSRLSAFSSLMTFVSLHPTLHASRALLTFLESSPVVSSLSNEEPSAATNGGSTLSSSSSTSSLSSSSTAMSSIPTPELPQGGVGTPLFDLGSPLAGSMAVGAAGPPSGGVVLYERGSASRGLVLSRVLAVGREMEKDRDGGGRSLSNPL
ncbi:hypothetical protein DFJ73DRAFT_865875 [Zopfochytrium polystomum]|nr:hypothetical protein DFJ73DRAFT_865875 [Zopfochytrium polystomum]